MLYLFQIVLLFVVAQATGEVSMKRAELLIDLHFKNLSTQKSLLGVSEVIGQRMCEWDGKRGAWGGGKSWCVCTWILGLDV